MDEKEKIDLGKDFGELDFIEGLNDEQSQQVEQEQGAPTDVEVDESQTQGEQQQEEEDEDLEKELDEMLANEFKDDEEEEQKNEEEKNVEGEPTNDFDKAALEELQKEKAELQTKVQELQKEVELWKQKYEDAVADMVDKKVDFEVFGPILDKLENSKELMLLVKMWGDDDKKDKLNKVLDYIVYNATGHRLSQLLKQASAEKASSLIGDDSAVSPPTKGGEKKSAFDFIE